MNGDAREDAAVLMGAVTDDSDVVEELGERATEWENGKVSYKHTKE